MIIEIITNKTTCSVLPIPFEIVLVLYESPFLISSALRNPDESDAL